MRVKLRNPDRDVEVSGPRKVRDVLAELGVDPDTVLVIRDKTLITREERVEDADQIEIRPVISGGSRGGSRPAKRSGADQAADPPAEEARQGRGSDEREAL